MEKNRNRKSKLDSCISSGSFLWFSHMLSKRQRNKVILARSALVKRLQKLQQKKKMPYFLKDLEIESFYLPFLETYQKKI